MIGNRTLGSPIIRGPKIGSSMIGDTTIQQSDSVHPDPTSTTRVLYVGSVARSGSTLIDRLLGEIPGCVSTGELYQIWGRGLLENRLCGCGVPFRDCSFWTSILHRAFGGIDLAEAKRIHDLTDRVQRVRRLGVLLGRRGSPGDLAELSELTGILRLLYRSIAAESGASIVVDSSKEPLYGMVLRQTPDLAVRFIHLIRDSRAVAFSWMRKRPDPSVHWKQAEMIRLGPQHCVRNWLITNALLHLLATTGAPYFRLTYESFAADPESGMKAILHFAGITVDPARSLLAGEATLRTQHTVSGNRMRFQTGPVRVQADMEWRKSMPLWQRLFVLATTAPLLAAYGYFGNRDTAVVVPACTGIRK